MEIMVYILIIGSIGLVAWGVSLSHKNTLLRMPNIMDPYTPGEKAGFGGGAAILWSATARGSDSEIVQETGSPNDFGTYTKEIRRTETPGSLPVTTLSIDGAKRFP